MASTETQRVTEDTPNNGIYRGLPSRRVCVNWDPALLNFDCSKAFKKGKHSI